MTFPSDQNLEETECDTIFVGIFASNKIFEARESPINYDWDIKK